MMETDRQTRFIPATKWSQYHPWPSIGGLRWLISCAAENGFSRCIRRVGGRVLISEADFFAWVDEHGKSNGPYQRR